MVSSFSSFPQLITDRLCLRQLTMEDQVEIYLLRSNDIVNKYLDRPKAERLEDAQEFIRRINSVTGNKPSMFWAICFRGNDKLIGTICLWNFSERENKADIGYELLPQFHGNGIMQEAFSKVVDFGFSALQLNCIEAWTVQQNSPSIKILERNLFRRNIELENQIDRSVESPDTIIYSLSKVDYLHSRL